MSKFLTAVSLFFLFGSIQLVSQKSHGTVRCEQLFKDEELPSKTIFDGALNSENFDLYSKQILEMAKVLVKENHAQLKWGFENQTVADDLKPKVRDVFSYSLERVRKPEFYSRFPEVGIITNDPWGSTVPGISLRTNGRIAFLWETYRFRRGGRQQKFKAVYIENGKIKAVDQAEVLLSTLPETTTIYRQMSELEKSKWEKGELVKSRSFGWKIHFSPAPLKWNDNSVYGFQIPREQLLKLYRKGLLEVNTYDVSIDSSGMATPKAGLEFEIVVVGQLAVEQILPFMKYPNNN